MVKSDLQDQNAGGTGPENRTVDRANCLPLRFSTTTIWLLSNVPNGSDEQRDLIGGGGVLEQGYQERF